MTLDHYESCRFWKENVETNLAMVVVSRVVAKHDQNHGIPYPNDGITDGDNGEW